MEYMSNPSVAEIKSKGYQMLSPMKDSGHQSHQVNAERSCFEDYLRSKYENKLQQEVGGGGNMQKNGSTHNLNSTKQNKIIDQIFVNSPQKQPNKVTSAQLNGFSPSTYLFNKQISSKFTLKSIVTNQFAAQTKGQLNEKRNNSLKNKSLHFIQEEDQAVMKNKLRNQQWTSTLELQNLRSSGGMLSENVSKCVSPAKLRVSMPLIEEIQSINLQEKIQQSKKKNAQSNQQQKYIKDLNKINSQLDKINKTTKNNLPHFHSSTPIIQSSQNSHSNMNGHLNKSPPPDTRHNKNQCSNVEEESICSSISQYPLHKIKNPSFDDNNWNLNLGFEEAKTRNQISSQSCLNKCKSYSMLNQFSQQYIKENNKEDDQKNTYFKPRIGRNIGQKDTKKQAQLELNKSDLSTFNLHTPKELKQQVELDQNNNKPSSLKHIELSQKSETLIEGNTLQKSKSNQLTLQIPRKHYAISMDHLDVQEEEEEETLLSNLKPKTMIFKNIQDHILYDKHWQNNSIDRSREEFDGNTSIHSKQNHHNIANNNNNNKMNEQSKLYKQKSNFILTNKSNSNQQTQAPNSPISTTLEKAKNQFKLQLMAQSPTNNRKEQLIQQIFLQKQKSNKQQNNGQVQQNIIPNSPQLSYIQNKQDHIPPLQFYSPFQQIPIPSPMISPITDELTPPLHPLLQQIAPPLILDLNFQRSFSINQNQLSDQSNSNSNTPQNQTAKQNSFILPQRQRQVSSIEYTHNGGYHNSQGLLNQILKKNTKHFSNKLVISSSSNSPQSQVSATNTPIRNQQRKKTKYTSKSLIQNDINNLNGNFTNIFLQNHKERDSLSPTSNTSVREIKEQQNSKRKSSNSLMSNQLRFRIDELCQGLEVYLIKDSELMKEIKQNEIDSSTFCFYISKYLQLAQYELPNQIKSKDKLVLFKVNSSIFDKLKIILTKKMTDMNIESQAIERIIKIFEMSKSNILASNVLEEIGSKKLLRNLIQVVIQEIKDNTNISILNQFSDQKALLDNATHFFSCLFNGEYETVYTLCEVFLENKFNVTLIEFFLLKNFAYNSLCKNGNVRKGVVLRVLEKIEQVRCNLLPNYDDNITLYPESRIQSLLFDLGIHSTPVHKFIKPLKNKYLPDSQNDPFSYFLKQEVKYLVTEPRLRKMARVVEANLKQKEDFQMVSQSFLDILKKQKSVRFTTNQLLNIEIRIMKVSILLGLEEDYLGLFNDIADLESNLKEEIDQFYQQNSNKLNIMNFKQSLDIHFISFVIELTFNQYAVFNAYDIFIAKKFYSLNNDIIAIQISSLENLLIKKKNPNMHFIQKSQKIPQFINLLKKIFFQTQSLTQ